MTTTAPFSSNETELSSSNVSFIQSQKGKPMLTNTNDKLIKMVGEHCHLEESEKIDIRVFREKVKQRVIDETTPVPRIYDEECAKTPLSTAAIAVLPSEREITRRAVTSTIPTTQLFNIPDPFSKTLRDDNFIVLDKMITRRQRIILFGTVEQLKMLFSSDLVLMDGTFSSCPVMFEQLYTLHSIKFEQCNLSIFFSFTYTYPILDLASPAFLVCCHLNTSVYQFLFQELKSIAIQMNLNFAPSTIMTDFEHALPGVVKTEAIYRAIQRFGFASSYNNHVDVKHFCRKLIALSLLPEPIIEDTYDELVKSLSLPMKKQMNQLLEYFQEQWFNKVPITQWCVHGLSMRTNSNAEAFHSRFNRRVQIHHPNIWSFIKLLQGEESRFYHTLIQFNAGLGARTKQAKTIAIQRRIDNLDKRYYDSRVDVMEYLNKLSFTVAKRKK
ncbi:unnamed protein product [Rotaria sp. Silwood1]|nr:unnamed protein product [Rotaria sp. Silwood1]